MILEVGLGIPAQIRGHPHHHPRAESHDNRLRMIRTAVGTLADAMRKVGLPEAPRLGARDRQQSEFANVLVSEALSVRGVRVHNAGNCQTNSGPAVARLYPAMNSDEPFNQGLLANRYYSNECYSE